MERKEVDRDDRKGQGGLRFIESDAEVNGIAGRRSPCVGLESISYRRCGFSSLFLVLVEAKQTPKPTAGSSARKEFIGVDQPLGKRIAKTDEEVALLKMSASFSSKRQERKAPKNKVMDGNKDEARRCARIGARTLNAGDKARAQSSFTGSAFRSFLLSMICCPWPANLARLGPMITENPRRRHLMLLRTSRKLRETSSDSSASATLRSRLGQLRPRQQGGKGGHGGQGMQGL
ncbi:hypothetical protein HPP92_027332, partial [Vanilla planifolia]